MFVTLHATGGVCHFVVPNFEKFTQIALVECKNLTGIEENFAIILGDFVEPSFSFGQCLSIVGTKSPHLLYVDTDFRRNTCKITLVDAKLNKLTDDYRIVLHLKTDK